jgi:hypothetical protein
MTLRYINVSAWGGAGKSVLVSLFDGHPDIAINAMHDKTPFILKESYPSAEKLGDFRPILRDLTLGGYINFQLLSVDGKVDVHLSSSDQDVLKVPCDFDYYSFEKRWLNKLRNIDGWSKKNITNLIYDSYIEQQYPQADKNYLTVMGVPDAQETIRFTESFENSYVLAIRRPIKSILSTKLNRTLRYSEELNISSIRRHGFLIMESYRIARFDVSMELLSQRIPHRVKVVCFDEMVTATHETINTLLDFMQLDRHNNCYNPTFFGHELKNDRVSYIGHSNDSNSASNSGIDSLLVSFIYRFTTILFRYFRL